MTSIVYVAVKVVIEHDKDDDAADLIGDCDYSFSIDPAFGQSLPKIVNTEIMEIDDRGECHPTEHYLLKDRVVHGLLDEHDDPSRED
jgi:hypothetical protein